MDGFYLLSFYSEQNLNLILTFRPFVESRLSETANVRFKLRNSQNWKSASNKQLKKILMEETGVNLPIFVQS